MTPVRTLLVDDGRLARDRLRRMLQAHPEIVVVAEASSVDEAAAAIADHAIDLVFLDVQMPNADGFALFDRCDVTARVVFVTAFDEHALRAFEVNALDYVLKPVARERLANCVARLRSMPPLPSAPLEPVDRICVTDGRGMRFIALAELLAIRAAGDYTELHLRDGTTPLSRNAMMEWERRLPSEHFVRVHRSAIVRLAQVERLERQSTGATAHVGGLPAPIPVSRRALPNVEARLRELSGG